MPERPPSLESTENVTVPVSPVARSSVENCRALALATVRLPAATRVVPLNVLEPESVSEPEPSFVSDPAPVNCPA
jgi:hypothetical protein